MTPYRVLMVGAAPSTLRVASATHFRTRLIGLLGSSPFTRFDVLRLAPCRAVHTLGMSESIDLVFVDRNRRILRIVAGLKPWRIAVCAAAVEVWEFQAGRVARLALNIGDALPW